MSLSVLHSSWQSLTSLLDSLSGSYITINLSSFPETETVCQSVCLLFQQSVALACGWERSQTELEIETSVLAGSSGSGCLEVMRFPMSWRISIVFWVLPGCASTLPGLGWQIGALCHGFHSSFQHPRGSWTWTLPDATCHLYTVGTKLLLWCICQELNGLVSGLTKRAQTKQTELPQHTTNTHSLWAEVVHCYPIFQHNDLHLLADRWGMRRQKLKTCMQELILQSSFAGTSIANGVLNIMLRLVTLTWLCWQTSASSEPVTSPVTPLALVPPQNSSALEALLSQLHTDSKIPEFSSALELGYH